MRFYGNMRCQAQKGGKHRYYRCRAKQLGYECDQPSVGVEKIDDQVTTILMNLKPPKDWRKGVTEAVSEILGERNLEERLAEIRAIIKRMDTRWDHGFFANEEEYFKQRLEHQQELEQLASIRRENIVIHFCHCQGRPHPAPTYTTPCPSNTSTFSSS